MAPTFLCGDSNTILITCSVTLILAKILVFIVLIHFTSKQTIKKKVDRKLDSVIHLFIIILFYFSSYDNYFSKIQIYCFKFRAFK